MQAKGKDYTVRRYKISSKKSEEHVIVPSKQKAIPEVSPGEELENSGDGITGGLKEEEEEEENSSEDKRVLSAGPKSILKTAQVASGLSPFETGRLR